MSTRQDSAPAPTVRSREDLIAWIAAGSKPAHAWRIGTEHEKFLFYTDTLQPVPYAGKRGLDMMYRTATIQVNLDFADEADMVKKFRVSLALQPVATAIFACSPFTEGRPNGFLSMRSEVWRDTDKARTGMLPFVFEPG